MKKNWLLTTLLATVTIAMGTTTTAFASPPNRHHSRTSRRGYRASQPRRNPLEY